MAVVRVAYCGTSCQFVELAGASGHEPDDHRLPIFVSGENACPIGFAIDDVAKNPCH